MMGMTMGAGLGMAGGLGSLIPTNGCGCGCISNTNVYLTNMVTSQTNGPGMTFTFTIEGGSNGFGYELFSTTNLVGNPATNSIWTWLGTGTNCGTYAITNQATNASFFILGGPQPASDGSGLTVAYEQLVSTNLYADAHQTPTAWYIWQGLNPQTPGIGTQDLNGSGLLNWQDYLYGSNPQGSVTFSVWVGEPSGTSGIP